MIAALALGLALHTSIQVETWHSSETVWQNAARIAPMSPKPWVNLATVRMAQGEPESAENFLDQASLLAKIRHDRAALDVIAANRAVLRIGVGRFADAQALLRDAPYGSARWQLCQRVKTVCATE